MAVMTPTLSQAPPQAEPPLRMGYEEFLAWAGEDIHAEWVNGEVIVQMLPDVGRDAAGSAGCSGADRRGGKNRSGIARLTWF